MSILDKIIIIYHNNHARATGYRDDIFLEMVEGIISKYEKFMPHEESK